MSIDSIHIILDLILKSWAGTLAQPEEERLNELLEDPEWAQLKQDLEDDRFIMGRFKEYEKYDKIVDFSCFLKRIRKHKKRRVLTTSVRRTIYVAASLFVFVMAGGVWWSERTAMVSPEEGREIVIETTIDRNSVRLILGDNQMIPLTSKHEVAILNTKGILHSEGLRTLNYTYVKRDSLENVSEYHTLIVPKGERQKVIFSDSSWVVLNAQSTMKYPVVFRGKERKVYVEGEAYFEVTRDEKYPFVVSVKNFDVRVLGTSFNVMSYDDEFASSVTLLSRKVETTSGHDTVRLSPGEQVSITSDNRMTVQKTDINVVVSWMDGKFGFSNERLDVIMRKICRWYDVEVLYAVPGIRERRFTGAPASNMPLKELLEALSTTTNLQFSLQDGVITIKQN